MIKYFTKAYWKERKRRSLEQKLERLNNEILQLRQEVRDEERNYAWAMDEPWELSAYDAYSAAVSRFNNALAEYRTLKARFQSL